jgi:hypothetical protein
MRPRLRSFGNDQRLSSTDGDHPHSSVETSFSPDVVALQKENAALTEQLRDLEEIGTRMHAEITALRQLTAAAGNGAPTPASELVDRLTAVTRERDELRTRWASLAAVYRDGVGSPPPTGDALEAEEDVDLSLVIEEHQLQRQEIALYEAMLTEAVGELKQLRSQHSRGMSTRESLIADLEECVTNKQAFAVCASCW